MPKERRQAEGVSEAFYKETLNKEKKLLLNQLRFKAQISESSALLKTMHMAPERLCLDRSLTEPLVGHKNPRSSLCRTSNTVDQEGKEMLSLGPFPNFGPIPRGPQPVAPDWNEVDSRYKELQEELTKINEEIKLKSQEVSIKIKCHNPYEKSPIKPFALPSISTQAGSLVSGSGFQWSNAMSKTSYTTDYSFDGNGDYSSVDSRYPDARCTQKWGSLSKTLNSPERSLYLRTDPLKGGGKTRGRR